LGARQQPDAQLRTLYRCPFSLPDPEAGFRSDFVHFPLNSCRQADSGDGGPYRHERRRLATGVDYLREGRWQFQRAKNVVVAGYAIETSRLLLMSANGRFPDGLANSSGLVGTRN
jgi:hypothetical protein